jgi:hypothetical protein
VGFKSLSKIIIISIRNEWDIGYSKDKKFIYLFIYLFIAWYTRIHTLYKYEGKSENKVPYFIATK